MNKVIAAVMMLAIASLFCGCGREDVDPVTERMNDKEYVKKLEVQNEEQRAIMREIDVFRKEYEVASAEDPEGKGEKMKALLKKRDELHQKLEINRLKSTAIIRERMRESAEKK